MKQVALLRGINVSGKNKIPMQTLISLCEDLGCNSVHTILQTGNVIFTSDKSTKTLESNLERAIQSEFQFEIPVIVRTATDFAKCMATTPLLLEASIDPSHVLLYLTKKPIRPEALETLQQYAAHEEVIHIQESSLWIHFPNGVGRSKLTPAVIDRCAGSPATGRNWNTASKILELL